MRRLKSTSKGGQSLKSRAAVKKKIAASYKKKTKTRTKNNGKYI